MNVDALAEKKKREDQEKLAAAQEAERRAQAARDEAQAMRAQAETASRAEATDPTPLLKAAEAEAMAKRQAAARAQSAEAARLAEESRKREELLGSTDPALPPAQLADTARLAGAAASSLAPGLGAAPGSTTPAGAAADVARLSAAPKVETVGVHSSTPSPKAVEKATQAVVTAPANRVEAVIDKLKKEEAKGGPGIWDVIEAAAAGWQGKVPLYVQKQLEAAAEEARTEQIKTTASLQAALEAEQQAEAFKRQKQLLAEELASREKIALGQSGLAMPGLSSLSAGFLGGGK